MIFTTGRVAFLEYLRNLTPQILIFSVAIILGSNLDTNRIDICNIKQSFPFIMAFGVFFAAAVANMTCFFENAAISIPWIDRASRRLLVKKIKGTKWFCAISKLIWKKKKIFFLEIGLAFVIVQVGFIVVLMTSINTATNLYKTIHPPTHVASQS